MDKNKITKLLKAHSSGDENALDELMPLVYDKMYNMARYRMLGEKNNHTLSTTGLLHEAYLKLVKFDRVTWENRAHFFGMASQIMRNILVDYAVKKKAQKRGGEWKRVTMGKGEIAIEMDLHNILSIHQALEQLSKVDNRQVRVVECRFFGGLTLKETAQALNISTATVSRDWKMAKAWLNREITKTKKEG